MVELVWDGKYDAQGKRVAPLRVALPFQTVETVNESAQQRQKMLDLFAKGRNQDWRNRLIWGDKKYVLPSLLPEFAGKVDLIYIDPPFATGADFSLDVEIGENQFTKNPSMIEQKAYRDTWGYGIDSFLQWFYETTAYLYDLLSETGSIYVHLSHHIGQYAKVILDEVFGHDNFQNEIIWLYKTGGATKTRFSRKHDNIFFYTKSSSSWAFNPQKERSYMMHTYGFSKSDFQIDEATGQQYSMVYARDVWDIPSVGSATSERVGYPTQKPEALLERIVKASSNEGDLILDCFCGSGTTASVAEKLGRRWITCDLGRFAIHTARKRLLAIEEVQPFIVQNLGKYERQIWQKAEFGEQAQATIRQYRKFILDLYHADVVEGYTWLHGKKDGRMVHVGSVDSPIALGDVKQIAIDFQRSIGTGKNAPKVAGVYILGWDFALDMNETARQIAQEAGLDVKFVRIPREVLEGKAVEQDDIRFFELAALSVDIKTKGREVSVALTDFMVPPDDVPQDVIEAVNNWSEWIDYWAIDFDYQDDAFHNQWQSYRTRQDRKLDLQRTHTYKEGGQYTIVVKVIDILGNDTTKAITIEVV